MRIRSALILFVLVAAAAAVAVPVAPAATAPCWKRLINDWFDGRIDRTYQAQCYRDAIDNLPEDVDAYSDARDEINRALLAAIRESGGEAKVTPTTPIAPEPAPAGGETPADDDGLGSGPGDGTDDGTDDGGVAGTTTDEEDLGEAAGSGGGGNGSDDEGVIGVFKPANADSVPVPLLVLAGLALLLLAAAAAGFVARRVQARRVRVTPSGAAAPTREIPPET